MSLSNVFRRLGRLDEALAMCSSALEIYSKAPGDNQKLKSMCHNNTGDILRQQDKPGEATEHFSTGLAMTLKREGETASAADLLLNIGAHLADQNKLDEAMEKLTSVLRIYEKAKIDTRVATCHFNIGDVLKQQGKLDAALEHARKALAIRRLMLLHEHADCGETHMLIGSILFRSGKLAEALDEFDNALRIRKNVFGEMTLQVAAVYERKAICFFNLQNWREAVTFFEATIHIRTALGADGASLVMLKAALLWLTRRSSSRRSDRASQRMNASETEPLASTMSSSSSSVAAPAVVDNAELLKMVNQCTHYKCTSRRKAHSHTSKKKRFFLTFLVFLSSRRHTTQWCARSACAAI
jgi:tetratricopeptide (TPR) repeat protein